MHPYVISRIWISHQIMPRREDAYFRIGEYIYQASLILIDTGEFQDIHEFIVGDPKGSDLREDQLNKPIFQKTIWTFYGRAPPVLDELYDEHIAPLVNQINKKRKRSESNEDDENDLNAEKYFKIEEST